MPKKPTRATPPAPAPQTELRDFTLDFFRQMNTPITPRDPQKSDTRKQDPRKDQRPQEVLRVELPGSLADHFGKPELNICFHNAQELSGVDLVAHGSRTFDRILSYLDRHSAVTLLHLPSRFKSSEEILRAVRPLNASISGLQMQERTHHLYAFTWRITYRADDKREELYTVVLDENGERLPLHDEPHATADSIDLEALIADAAANAPNNPPADPTATANTDADGDATRLPPMTHLVRLAETARKYAIYHADLRCVTHEAEILPRLYTSLNRLTTYYGQQIEEVYDSHDPTGEKRRILEEDLNRKIAEEVENHRLRVQLSVVSYAVFYMPVAVAEIRLSDGRRHAEIQVVRNRYNGHIQRPTCHACGEETTAVALDRSSHITCDRCLHQCGSCLEIVCESCGVEPCPVCKRENCDTCGDECWACGRRACRDHADQCPICADTVCFDCQAECHHCGLRQCRSHLRADAVPVIENGTENGVATTVLVCADCAVRCPGCNQYSAAVALCSASGQRFCANCLVTCARCGQRTGPGFYRLNPTDHQPYCVNCLQECPACNALSPTVETCRTCGVSCCHTCGVLCAVCNDFYCTQHSARGLDCGHSLCRDHLTKCAIGLESLCPICFAPCAICERHYCDQHDATCRRCEQTYCRECVRPATELCDTCALSERESVPVNLSDEPCAADQQVIALAPHFRWTRTANACYTIYTGHGALMTGALIVAENSPPRVLVARKLGFLDTLIDRFNR